MNLLIVDNSIAFTGALKCAVNEAETLSDKHQFVFVLHHHSNQVKILKNKGYTVYQLPLVEIKKSLPILLLYPIMLVRNSIMLLKILRAERIDILQVNDFYNMLGVMVKMLGYNGKLITYVRFLPSVMPGPLRKLWIKLGLKYSHKIIAVSDAVLNQLPKHKKVTRIYDPVQLTENLTIEKDATSGVIKLLYLSNYIQGKGQDSAVEAFAQAYAQNQQLRLTFMGGDMGMEKNAAFKETLIERVNTLGLGNVVEFAPFNSDVESAIKSADIILNFSEAESFSMTCLEAAFYGTALIATECGGPQEIIDNDNTGITVPVKDIDAMTAAIVELANNHSKRTEFARAGKIYVTQKFSIENYKQSFEKAINGD